MGDWFDDRMTEMEREIESLDIAGETRTALRQLAVDTRRRHASIQQSTDGGRKAAKKLDEQIGRLLGLLREQTGRLEEASAEASLAAKYAEFSKEARERELRGEGRDHPENDNGGS